MKTKWAALALSFLVALGLSGCYTEFATTSGSNGDYGSSYNISNPSDTSQYGYGPTYYDSTGSLAVNPDYQSNNYGYGSYGPGGYGYGYSWPPYGYGYYGSPYMYYPSWTYSMFYPSAAWWPMDSWYLGFGMNSWYGGPYAYGGLAGWGNWPSYYAPYAGGYYPYNPYYDVYSPYSPYSYYPWYGSNGYNNGYPGRVRNGGDTRYGRDGYSQGTVVPPQSGGGANVGTANSTGGVTGNVREGQVTRTRVGSGGEPTANGVRTTTSNPRVRERSPLNIPSQGNATPNPQHRVRERAPSYTPYTPPQQQPQRPATNNSQPRVREQAPNYNPPQQRPNQNSSPQSNPQPRVREQAPSYNPPPQQNSNPSPSYNPPPQNTPPPSAPPAQAPPPRIRHGYVSYNNGARPAVQTMQRAYYRRARFGNALPRNSNYTAPARSIARYQTPGYGYRPAVVQERPMRPSAVSAPARSSAPIGGGRTRH